MTRNFEQITSLQNAKVKQIGKLRDKRGRERGGRFVIDDIRDLNRALDCGYRVAYMFYCPDLWNPADDALLERLQDTLIYEVSAEVLNRASYRQNPGGMLAAMIAKPVQGLAELAEHTARHILALVNLQKPGNIGALLRTADATGFSTVFLVDTALDIYNPNIIRSSTGACFLDNVYYLSSNEARNHFSTHGYSTIAAVVDGDRDLFETDFTQNSALILGTEDTGLEQGWINAATQRVRIPMVGKLTDSLNVSVSGAIFMYEALRQHR